MPTIATNTHPDPTDLTTAPIADLVSMGGDHPILKNVMERVFRPKDRDKLTVSAFGSAL